MYLNHGQVFSKKPLNLDNIKHLDFYNYCLFFQNLTGIPFKCHEVQIEYYDNVEYSEYDHSFEDLRLIPEPKLSQDGFDLIYKGTAYSLEYTDHDIYLFAVHKSDYRNYLESLVDINVKLLMSKLPNDSDFIFMCSSYCEVLPLTEDFWPCPMSRPISFPVYCQTSLIRLLNRYRIKTTSLNSSVFDFGSNKRINLNITQEY